MHFGGCSWFGRIAEKMPTTFWLTYSTIPRYARFENYPNEYHTLSLLPNIYQSICVHYGFQTLEMQFMLSSQWLWVLILITIQLNDVFLVPEEFSWDPQTRTFGDPSRRPELQETTIEYIAPAEYMVYKNIYSKNNFYYLSYGHHNIQSIFSFLMSLQMPLTPAICILSPNNC